MIERDTYSHSEQVGRITRNEWTSSCSLLVSTGLLPRIAYEEEQQPQRGERARDLIPGKCGLISRKEDSRLAFGEWAFRQGQLLGMLGRKTSNEFWPRALQEMQLGDYILSIAWAVTIWHHQRGLQGETYTGIGTYHLEAKSTAAAYSGIA